MPLADRDCRLITVFGLGSLRPAPGTWGSLPPVIAASWLIGLGFGPHQAPWIYHAVLGAIMLFGIAACVLQGDPAEARFARKDPPDAVADELAGQCLPLMFLPAQAFATPNASVITLIYAFIAFRVFDIIKLPPAAQFQRRAGGWGILLDDLAAGIFALALVQVLTRTML